MPSRVDLNTILAIVVPAIVGFVVWFVQSKLNARAAKTLKEKVDVAHERTRVTEETRLRIEAEYRAVLVRLNELETQGSADSQSLALLRQEMLPMAEAMKRKLVEMLTHPSGEFEIPDKLLARVKETGAAMPGELTKWLEERVISTNPHVTEQERLAAEALPILTRLAQLEHADKSAPITGVQLVSSTGLTPETKRVNEG